MRRFRSYFVIIAIAIVCIFGLSFISYLHTETKTATVTGKEHVIENNGEGSIRSFYLVYTDKGTMKLEDDVLRGNWLSSDVYGSLRIDSTYTFTTSGYRIGLLSAYPNIIKVQ